VLTAGTKYYIEALHKEGIESDHLAVGWQLPNGSFERPIPGIRLIPLGTSGASEDVFLIEEHASDDELKIYPNPSRRNETIHLSGFEKESSHLSIEVISLAGQTILKSTFDCSECDREELSLDNNLSPGFYLVSVTTNKKRTVKRLLVR
jgi:hypothetical protein